MTSMKAWTYSKYGAPEKVMTLRDLPVPSPTADLVLVKIHCTAINDYDWSMVTGNPGIYKLLFGLFKPRHAIPGMEFSGVVESVGPNVSGFQVGDEVYGDTSDSGFGTMAEFMCVKEKAVRLKPSNMSFEEAVTVPHASMLAYQGLIERGGMSKGMRVLINGGGGGVGFFSLQLAKLYGCHVTGVDTGRKLDKMRELGYDEVLDYRTTDFCAGSETYDLILDCKTTRSPRRLAKALNRNGIYATVGGKIGKLLRLVLFGWTASIFGKKKLVIVVLKPNKDLKYIEDLHARGEIKFMIDGPYAMTDVPSRLQYFGEGLHTGKVVISVTE